MRKNWEEGCRQLGSGVSASENCIDLNESAIKVVIVMCGEILSNENIQKNRERVCQEMCWTVS